MRERELSLSSSQRTPTSAPAPTPGCVLFPLSPSRTYPSNCFPLGSSPHAHTPSSFLVRCKEASKSRGVRQEDRARACSCAVAPPRRRAPLSRPPSPARHPLENLKRICPRATRLRFCVCASSHWGFISFCCCCLQRVIGPRGSSEVRAEGQRAAEAGRRAAAARGARKQKALTLRLLLIPQHSHTHTQKTRNPSRVRAPPFSHARHSALSRVRVFEDSER